MRILVIAVGSRGDIQPYLALGKGLKAAGYSVLVLTNGEFEPLCLAEDLACLPIELDVQGRMQSSEARAAIEGASVFASFRELARLARRGAELMAVKGLEAARGVDLILAGFGGLYLGSALSEKLGIRLVQAYNVPFSPTGEFPGPLFPIAGAPRIVNRLTHRATRAVVWQTARMSGEPVRRKILGLGASPMVGAFGRGVLASRPVLYGISDAVIPRPADWEEGLEMTGYWFLERKADWNAPEALESFLSAGPAPIYLGFGSMSHRDPKETMSLVLEAIGLAGCRAVVSSGWGGLSADALPKEVFLAGDLPHDWLFPRMAAVVHHGGAGTTAAGLRAGVPSILVPFHGDQPFWGQRVASLGVGPAPLPRRGLAAAGLASAIRHSLEDGAMRDRAERLGRTLRAENGVARAVQLISQVDAPTAFR